MSHVRLPACSRIGTVNEKVAPCRGVLCTQNLPPKWRMISRLIGNPRPVPWSPPFPARGPCWNRSKIRS